MPWRELTRHTAFRTDNLNHDFVSLK